LNLRIGSWGGSDSGTGVPGRILGQILGIPGPDQGTTGNGSEKGPKSGILGRKRGPKRGPKSDISARSCKLLASPCFVFCEKPHD